MKSKMIKVLGCMILINIFITDLYSQYSLSATKLLVCDSESVRFSGSSPGFVLRYEWSISPLEDQEPPKSGTDYIVTEQSVWNYKIQNINLEGRYSIRRYIRWCKKKQFNTCKETEETINSKEVYFVNDLEGTSYTIPTDICQGGDFHIYSSVNQFATGISYKISPTSALDLSRYVSDWQSGDYTDINIFLEDNYYGSVVLEVYPFFRNSNGTCYGSSETYNPTMSPKPTVANKPSGSSSICFGESISLTTNGNVSTYQWDVYGSSHGNISQTTPTVSWTPTGTGNAYVRVRGTGTNCDPGPWSEYKTITIVEVPGKAGTPSGPRTVSSGANNVEYAINTNFKVNYWLEPREAGNVTTVGQKAYIDYSLNYEGQAAIYAREESCKEGTTSDPCIVTVNALQPGSAAPSGNSSMCPNDQAMDLVVDYNPGFPYRKIEYRVLPTYAGTITAHTAWAFEWMRTFWHNTHINYTGLARFSYRYLDENELPVSDWSQELETMIYGPVSNTAAPTGNDVEFCQGLSSSIYTTEGANFATDYEWEIIPANIGTLTQNGKTCTVNWNTNNYGTARIRVAGYNCGEFDWSDELTIKINPLPAKATTPFGETDLCEGVTSSAYQTSVLSNADEYIWTLNPQSAGTLYNNNNQTTIYWEDGFSGVAELSVKGVSCNEGEESEKLLIDIEPIPRKPNSPQGPRTVCQGTNISIYSVSELDHTNEYDWEIYPVQAGILFEDKTYCSVNWSTNFYGTAYLRVRGENCNQGEWSENMTIEVQPLPLMATVPSGPNLVCEAELGIRYFTTTLQNAEDYEWMLFPAAAGTIIGNRTSCTVNLNEEFIDNYSVRVRGISCDAGNWSNEKMSLIEPLPTDIATVSLTPEICQEDEPISMISSSSINANNYVWELDPPEAGSIAGVSQTATLYLDNEYSGVININVYAENQCGTSDTKQEPRIVVAKPTIPNTPVGDENVCAGTFSSEYYTLGSANAPEYEWHLSDEDAGILEENGTMCRIVWSNDFVGNVSLRVRGISCIEGPFSDYLNIEVHDQPFKPGIPLGESMVCLPTSVSSIFSINPTNADSYNWNINPLTAGFISGDDLTAKVIWNNNSSDEYAYISVESVKEYCDNSDASELLHVELRDKPEVTGGAYDSVFIDDQTFTIEYGIPKGGTYYLNNQEIKNGEFNPANIGLGNHFVEYVYRENGCTGTAFITVPVYNVPMLLNLNINSICLNDEFIELEGGYPPGGQYSGNGVSSGNLYPSIAGSGKHEIRYTITGPGYSSHIKDSITVLPAPPIPSVTSNKNVYCKGSNAQLSVSGEGGEYTWYLDDLLLGESNSATISGLNENTTVYVYEKNVLACISLPNEFTINVDDISAEFKADNTYILPGGRVNFLTSLSDLTSCNWEFGDGGTSNENNPSYFYYNEGNYTVSLEAESVNGCKDSITYENLINVDLNNSGINNLKEQNSESIFIYPNPVQTILYINRKGLEKSSDNIIALYELSGKLLTIDKTEKRDQTELNLSDLTPGEYILTIQTRNKSITKKIIKVE